MDERESWLDLVVLKRTKHIFGIYVFDRRQHFHICNVSASHELYFWDRSGKKLNDLGDEEHDELRELINEGDGQSDLVTYWDKYDIDRMLAKSCREGCLPTEDSCGFALTEVVFVTTKDAIEEAQESYQDSEF